MKLPNVPGEFYFRALVNSIPSEQYFSSEKEVAKFAKTRHGHIVWPIEIYENGTIYVPTKEELE